MSSVTVLSGPERRRRWSAAEKARIVEENLQPGAVVKAVADRHDVHANLLHYWRRPVVQAAGRTGSFLPVSVSAEKAPDDVEALKAMLLAEREACRADLREQALRIEQLKQRIAKLQHERFGQSSGRRASFNQLELQVFELEEDQAQRRHAAQTRRGRDGETGAGAAPVEVIQHIREKY